MWKKTDIERAERSGVLCVHEAPQFWLVGGFKHYGCIIWNINGQWSNNYGWLVVSNMNFIFHFIYGMSFFPLTKSIIFHDGHIAPPSSWGNSIGIPDTDVNHFSGKSTRKIWRLFFGASHQLHVCQTVSTKISIRNIGLVINWTLDHKHQQIPYVRLELNVFAGKSASLKLVKNQHPISGTFRQISLIIICYNLFFSIMWYDFSIVRSIIFSGSFTFKTFKTTNETVRKRLRFLQGGKLLKKMLFFFFNHRTISSA